MDKEIVGIIVKNDYDNILYHENKFFLEIEIDKNNDLRFTIEDKLSKILEKKAFRIEKISKKIPKLDLSNECNYAKNIVMYLVDVYMYSDNSNFLDKKDIIDNLSTSLTKDYYIKYVIRYDMYRNLVESYVGILIYLLWTLVLLGMPVEIRSKFLLDTLFYNFWTMITCIVLLGFILHKFIIPRIVNYLVKYDISKKTIKISTYIYAIVSIVFFFALIT